MARPAKLTRELTAKICGYIESSGAYLCTAARASGVDPSTVKRWRQRGRKAKIKIDAGEPITPIEALYFDFLKETDDKAAAMEIWAGQKLLSFAEISERSLHFFMSHRFPDHWSTLAAELRATQKRLAEVEKMLAARGVTDVAPNDIRDESPVEPNAATGGNASGQGGGMERKDQTGVETDPKQPPGEGLPQ
jgi:transposase-like protein